MYVIYDRPSDYPTKFVVRIFKVVDIADNIVNIVDKAITGQADTLEECRKLIPKGYSNVGRTKYDDPVIAEVWI